VRENDSAAASYTRYMSGDSQRKKTTKRLSEGGRQLSTDSQKSEKSNQSTQQKMQTILRAASFDAGRERWGGGLRGLLDPWASS
jgi:hypothetical protein